MASRFFKFGFANQRYSGIKPDSCQNQKTIIPDEFELAVLRFLNNSNDIDIHVRGWIKKSVLAGSLEQKIDKIHR
jgi:hypothetical protein